MRDRRQARQRAQARCRLAGGVQVADFLKETPERVVDGVLMNPPFARQADIAHVLHAAAFLKPGGKLVAVMSAGIEFRTDRKTAAFRDFLTAHDGEITRLPENSFKAAGTAVNTVLVQLTMKG